MTIDPVVVQDEAGQRYIFYGTFAAMDKIQLRVTWDGHWMGEKFDVSYKNMPALDVTVRTTASNL